jgi:hypothetical protein
MVQVPTSSATPADSNAIHALVGRHALPPGVTDVEVAFGEDSTGQPAVWITFVVEDDLHPSKQRVSELNRLVRTVTDDLLRHVSDRWPYVQFRVAA